MSVTQLGGGATFRRGSERVQPVGNMVHDGTFNGRGWREADGGERGGYGGYDCVKRWVLSLDRN